MQIFDRKHNKFLALISRLPAIPGGRGFLDPLNPSPHFRVRAFGGADAR